MHNLLKSKKILVGGQVQGVGFRPFVYNLAQELKLKGWVRNNLSEVEIHLEGTPSALEEFKQNLTENHPALADIANLQEQSTKVKPYQDFQIIKSKKTSGEVQLPPDQAPCAKCINEIHDIKNRRFHYPFTNCTQCGPRYSIIKNMPYDRVNTSMNQFKFCPACEIEYNNSANRRFHAEPNACHDCGPSLVYIKDDVLIKDNESAIEQTINSLNQGKIVAIKGATGFHLICDATNSNAVQLLRARKNRPGKPFAVMVGDVTSARRLIKLDDENEITSQIKPIILAPKQKNIDICELVAPGLADLGVMLPSMPLYYLICEKFKKPLVATSGNISGEPVLTDENEAKARLSGIADAWLIHNRPILRPADDSVLRIINAKASAVRLGRGIAPLKLKLAHKLSEPVLAVGAQQKNTITLAWNKTALISPHIGELSSKRGFEVFEKTIKDLQDLYKIKAKRVVCDKHSQYTSSRWAKNSGLKLIPVQHHKAHASALAAEHAKQNNKGLVFSWDGTGLGDDGRLWGGETFIGQPGDWRRVASFRKFKISAGERTALEPWRSAAALSWQSGLTFDEHKFAKTLYQAQKQNINTVYTSSAGRIFDAAAYILGLAEITSYEGEAPMLLEAIALAIDSNESLPLIDNGDYLEINWQPLLKMLHDDSFSIKKRASLFHCYLANTIADIADSFKNKISYVGLTGGVFQNRLLSELTRQKIEKLDIQCLCAGKIPANDGGLSYGQIIEYQYSN